MHFRILRTALENEVIQSGVEDERVFYAKISNFEELKKATSKEKQTQYEIKIPKSDKNAGEGRIRIRKTEVEGKEPTFVLTTKTALSDGSNYECSAITDEKNFIQFKYLCDSVMIKDRFTFAIEGTELSWEVDCFIQADGNYYSWCKIDLELKGQKLNALPNFPMTFEEVIVNQNGQRTEEEETKVRMLYDTIFKLPNSMLSN